MNDATFERILVPVDLTDRAAAALDWAARLAGPETTVVLLHVIETLEDVPFGEMEGFYRQLEERAVEILDGWVEDLGGRGVRTERRVVFGHRLEKVLSATADDVDLVLLRSHAVEPDKAGRGWGTLSYRVAVFAACPVLLVK